MPRTLDRPTRYNDCSRNLIFMSINNNNNNRPNMLIYYCGLQNFGKITSWARDANNRDVETEHWFSQPGVESLN